MNVLAILGIGLGIGWVGIWFLMQTNLKRQAELEQKIEALEARTRSQQA